MNPTARMPRAAAAALAAGMLGAASLTPMAWADSAVISNLTVAVDFAGFTDGNGNGTLDASDTLAYTFTLTATDGTSNAEILDIAATGFTVTAVDAPDGMKVAGSGTTVLTVSGTPVVGAGWTGTAYAPVFTLTVEQPPAHTIVIGTVAGTAVDVPAVATAVDATATSTLVELAGDTTDGLATLGDRIDYAVTVANTGDEAVSGVVATLGTTTATDPGPLAPGASTAALSLGSREVTAADLVAGAVPAADVDVAATGASGAPASATAVAAAVPTLAPAFSLVLTADASFTDPTGTTEVTWPAVGDLAALTAVTVTNGSALPIDAFRLVGAPLACDAPDAALAPAASSAACPDASAPVTGADLLAGSLGLSGSNAEVLFGGAWLPASLAVPSVPVDDATPAVAFDATGALADVNGDRIANAGETVTYTLTVTHGSPLSLPDLSASLTEAADSDPGLTGLPSAIAIHPGDAYATTAVHTVTAADEARGAITLLAVLEPTLTGFTLDPVAAAPVTILAGPAPTASGPEPTEEPTDEPTDEPGDDGAGTLATTADAADAADASDPTPTPTPSPAAADPESLSTTGPAGLARHLGTAATLTVLGALALLLARPRAPRARPARHAR